MGSCPWPSLANSAMSGARRQEKLSFFGRFLFRPIGDAVVKAF